ncbi:EamA/RhaT family transporter [Parasedimentitalea maritima]|uniref:EamA/RhaT family transporter n=1 Tax=Parasedimentitalea maritima TaxID=2578117 RepID=A0ABY2UPA1_9RHOB|nr:EamA family transporter [Zongyanglinia marina]TLP55340.1 EamA/RhaT family transporter [Zongyanglinia marina]
MTHDTGEGAPITEYILLLTLAALWGGSFTLIKVALENYPPMTIVSSRLLIGGFVLVLIAMIRRDVFPSTGKRWLELLIQGTLQGGLPFFLITWAEKYVASSVAGIVNSTPPMFVFLITVFILRTVKFDGFKLLGILFGMAGVAIIATSRAISVEDSSVLAVLAVLAASCSYAVGAIYGRRFGDQSAFITGGVSLLLAAVLTTPAAMFFEAPLSITPELKPTLALLALAFFSTALASLIFFRLIKTLGSLATTSNAYLRALFSMALGAVFLGEELGTSVLLASLSIFLGVFLVTGQFRKNIYDRMFGKALKNV